MPQHHRDAPLDQAKLRAAVKRIDEQLAQAKENAVKLAERAREYDELRDVLEDLPERLTHPVMVPLGPFAFFEGYLEHTNEVLVQLSSEWFVMKTAKQALGTVDRRQTRLRDDQNDVAREVHELEQRRHVAMDERAAGETPIGAHQVDCGVPGATVRHDEDGFLDIREPYTEDDHATSVSGGAPPRVGQVSPLAPAPVPVVVEKSTPSHEVAVIGEFSDCSAMDSRDPVGRLRELERLEEMEELDNLIESYERRGAVKEFDGPAHRSEEVAGAAAATEVARSPADIYKLMTCTGEDKIENDLGPPPRVGASPQIMAAPLSKATSPVSKRQIPTEGEAFTGIVREHGVSTDDLPARPAAALVPASALCDARDDSASGGLPGTGSTNKRVSKFKAERQRVGTGPRSS